MPLEFYKIKALDQDGSAGIYLLKIADEGFSLLTPEKGIEPKDYRMKDIALICEVMDLDLQESSGIEQGMWDAEVLKIWQLMVAA